MFRRVRVAIRRWSWMLELSDCQQRLYTLLQHRAAEEAGYYVGYDMYPGELHADIERYRKYIADLREKLSLPPFVEPRYYMQPLP